MSLRRFSAIAALAVREAMERRGKSRPETLFEQAFFDLREKSRAFKKDLEQKAAAGLEKAVVGDLNASGLGVQEAKLSLGQYRGSGFVTSFKLDVKVKDVETAEKVAEYLRGKYSPKWKLKGYDESAGIASYNVR